MGPEALVYPVKRGQARNVRIVIASDHGGYLLKEALKPLLVELGHDPVDVGTHSQAAVDYPDFAFLAAAQVAQGAADLGIIVDGAGIGSSIVANKLPGVRASLCNCLMTAKNARQHNDANVLTLGSGIVGERLAMEIVKTWLSTTFEPRHLPRIEKIVKLEGQLYGVAR